MSIRKQYYLTCTNCDNQFIDRDGEYTAESIKELRDLAKKNGWQYKRVENGTKWDFCPRCFNDKSSWKRKRVPKLTDEDIYYGLEF